MKKTILNFFVLAAFGSAILGCKSDKKNDTKNETATETTEQTQNDGRFVINTDQSTINWKGSKPMGEHIGTIDIASGVILFENGKPENGKVEFDMRSITVTDEDLPEEKKTMLENHLKGTAEGKEDDFFNITEYPTATFEITGTNNNGEMEGNLTMKGKTQSVSFPVDITWSSDGSSVELMSDNFVIDRTKWGVNYGSQNIYDNLGDNWISDEIELEFALKASKR